MQKSYMFMHTEGFSFNVAVIIVRGVLAFQIKDVLNGQQQIERTLYRLFNCKEIII